MMQSPLQAETSVYALVSLAELELATFWYLNPEKLESDVVKQRLRSKGTAAVFKVWGVWCELGVCFHKGFLDLKLGVLCVGGISMFAGKALVCM